LASGGTGGGGTGGGTDIAPTSGTNGLGGGGGGGGFSSNQNGGDGGDGIVIVRYPTANATPFTPLDLAPALWLDASDTATITAASGSVSQWDDKSGNGRNVTQGTAAAQPTTGAATLNGLNVLSFDGGDRLISSVTSAWNFLHDGVLPYFICTVIEVGSSADPNQLYAYLGTSSAASGNRGAVFSYEDRAILPANNATRVLISNGTSLIVDNTNSNIWTSQTWTVVTHLMDVGNATSTNRNVVKINNGSELRTNPLTALPSTSDAASPLSVGSSGAGTFLFVGKIGEIVIVSGSNATAQNRDEVIDYLTAKWGL